MCNNLPYMSGQIKGPDFDQTEHGKNCTNPWILIQLKKNVILFLWNSFHFQLYKLILLNVKRQFNISSLRQFCIDKFFKYCSVSKSHLYNVPINHQSNCLIRTQCTYPPPMVRILLSPARNMFAVLETFSSWRPTHSYFFLSGDSVNTNVSPVPK